MRHTCQLETITKYLISIMNHDCVIVRPVVRRTYNICEIHTCDRVLFSALKNWEKKFVLFPPMATGHMKQTCLRRLACTQGCPCHSIWQLHDYQVPMQPITLSVHAHHDRSPILLSSGHGHHVPRTHICFPWNDWLIDLLTMKSSRNEFHKKKQIITKEKK